MCVMTSLSKHFLTTDVKAIGQWSFRPVTEEHLGTRTIVAVFKQVWTEANDSEVLKISPNSSDRCWWWTPPLVMLRGC